MNHHLTIFKNHLANIAIAAVVAVGALGIASVLEAKAKICNTPNKLCGNELVVFDYGGDDVMGWVPDYAKKYPKKPRWSLFNDTNEALQKMKGGFQVDIAHITNSDTPFWTEYLQPWDLKKVTEWNDLYPFWKNAPGVQPINGKYYMIPTLFGMSAAVYDTKVIKPGEIKSLKDFANPKYKGRVVLPDAGYEVYAMCMLAFGNKKPFVKMTKTDVDNCSVFLREVHKNVRQYFTDSGSVVVGFKTGEVWMGFVWMDVPYTINKDRLANPKNAKELVQLDRNLGFALWVQGMVRAKTSKPAVDDLAYDYVNALNRGGADFLVNEFGYGSPNKKEMDAIAAKDPKALKDRSLDNIDGYVKSGKASMFGALPPDVSQYLLNEWEKIKTGQ